MKKILIVNPFGLGDALFSLFLAEAIRKAHPGCVIDFLGNERTEALLGMHSAIRTVHVMNRDALRALWPARPFDFLKVSNRLLSSIRREKYEALFDLSLGREFSFYAALMGIPKRIGLNHKNRGLFLTHKISIRGYAGKSVVRQQLDLLPLAGIEIPELSGRLDLVLPETARLSAEKRLAESGLSRGLYLVIAPGGGKSWGKDALYKQWSPARFAEIIRRLAGRGIPSILLGDASERGLLETIKIDSRTHAPVYAGLPIEEVCALLGAGRALLANDGGLAHLGSAVGLRTVTIFGPVDERVYGPFNPPPLSQNLVQAVPCRPCYSNFKFPPCKHNRACLEELSVERVWSELLEIA